MRMVITKDAPGASGGKGRTRTATTLDLLPLMPEYHKKRHDTQHTKRKIYSFLENPRSATSFPYHFGIFIVVLIAQILGANDDPTLATYAWRLECGLGVFFLCEFLLRLWVIDTEHKFRGRRGMFKYLTRFVCIIDIVIICTTFFIIVSHSILNKKENLWILDGLRFIQIFRLFHIDRQMTTWKMVKDMIVRSSYELSAAYYFSLLIFLVLALSVYEMETAVDISRELHVLNITNQTEVDKSERTFNNYGNAMWFSFVSFLTIGYGDIVPKYWLSKIVTCILSYAGYACFIAASTLVSVGMTIQIEEEQKNKHENKIRHTAAHIIQTWYRYHLASNACYEEDFMRIFRKKCYSLYLTEERIMKTRQLQKRLMDKRRATRTKDKLLERGASSCSDLKAGLSAVHKTSCALEPVALRMQRIEPNFQAVAGKRTFRRTESTHCTREDEKEERKKSIMHEIPKNVVRAAEIAKLNAETWTPGTNDKEKIEQIQKIARFAQQRRGSNETTLTAMTSSMEYSDIEQELEVNEYYNQNTTRRKSADINAIAEDKLIKYRPLIRFIYFVLFRQLLKKFRQCRRPYQLMDAENELLEMEHSRTQLVHELEVRSAAVVGKAQQSPFAPHDGKVSVLRRVELCEAKLDELERKADVMMMTTVKLQQLLGIEMELDLPSDDDSDASSSPHDEGTTRKLTPTQRLLHPPPASRRPFSIAARNRKKSLRRQATLGHMGVSLDD